MASVSERERTIGQRERAFDLQKNICVEITRGLAHLHRQWKLSAQKFELGKQIAAAEIRLNDARERFENAAAELREAYSERGGAVPPIDTRIDIETNASAVEEEDELSRQFRMELALQKVQDDAIPFSIKLNISTAAAMEQIFKNQPDPVVAEPVTLPEKIAACELKINRVRSEIDYMTEQVRPWRLMRNSSRLGELRTEVSPEMKFSEESLAAKRTELSQLTEQHKALIAEVRSQQNRAANQIGPSRQEAKTLANVVR